MHLNKYADRTPEEMVSKIPEQDILVQQPEADADSICGTRTPPASWTWSDVTTPRDQGKERIVKSLLNFYKIKVKTVVSV